MATLYSLKKNTEKYWVYPLFGQEKSVTDKKSVLPIPVAALFLAKDCATKFSLKDFYSVPSMAVFMIEIGIGVCAIIQ